MQNQDESQMQGEIKQYATGAPYTQNLIGELGEESVFMLLS